MSREKTVLVTGGATGIGYATAQSFAAQGYCVAVHYHKSQREAQALCAHIANQGGRALAVCADVSDKAEVLAMVDRVREVFGSIDVLINNAGIAQQKLFDNISKQDWDEMMAVNVGGVFYCCQAVLPDMIAQKKGSIVNVSSVWGITGAACEVHYCAAKAAIIGLTRALAKEVGPSGIRVNCVAPGVIETRMLDGFSQADKEALAEQTPLGRLGTPQEVAQAIYYLASERAAFITGQVLCADGGFAV